MSYLKIEGKEFHIENMMASASLKEILDLDTLVKTFPDTEWRPEVFPGLAFRLKKSKTCTRSIRGLEETVSARALSVFSIASSIAGSLGFSRSNQVIR